MKKIVIFLFVILTSVFTIKAQKFAFIDSDYILENMQEYRDAQEQLDKISIEWQKEIEEKFAEVDKLYKSFQAEAPLLPEDVKTKRQEEIIAKERDAKELQKQKFGKDGELYKKRQELIKPIQDKVFEAIEELANEQGYAIIFDRSGSLTVAYANEKYDKSDEVLQKLGYRPGGISTD